MIHTLDNPQLFYYLLNPISSEEFAEPDTEINFLDIQEIGTAKVGRDLLQLESAAHFWIEQIYLYFYPSIPACL